jgi:hypothetical protein
MIAREVARATIAFAASFVMVLFGYVALTVPGSWFPHASPIVWTTKDMTLTRGRGGVDRDALVVTAVDASGLALVTLNTYFPSNDYTAIVWTVAGVSDQTDVRLLWTTDYAPSRINSLPLPAASGRLLPVALARDPNWIGQIKGIALAIRGPLAEPLRISGASAKTMGVVGVLRERLDEWFAFEGWSGSSINTLTGGAELQALPLPVLLVVVLAIATGIWYALARKRTSALAALPAVVCALFVIAWVALDLRWMANLARQVEVTRATYAGKDWHARHLAAEDAPLFEFIERVRAKLPDKPARIVVVSDVDYFRGRAAYHLYPHNVWFDAGSNTVPAPSALHAGDYLVVYHRHGVQYNPEAQRLRWDGHEPVAVELLAVGPDAAAFRIRSNGE